MLGSPRSGSTWLLNMLAAHPDTFCVDEPLLGLHLGATTDQIMRRQDGAAPDRVLDVSRGRADYVFADSARAVWMPHLRRLVLDRYAAQLADAGAPTGCRLVFKEPHGSEAAELLSDLLPESHLLLLVRDGRDVVDSELDAVQAGGWGASTLGESTGSRTQRADTVREQSQRWAIRMEAVLRAREQHDPRRVHLVRYEDLLAGTTPAMEAILRWLDLPVPGDLDASVRRFAFDQIPAGSRGSGRFARAATPGLWRDHLDEEEQALMLDVMGPLLRRLGYPT